jgi:hypothetical protein
MRLANVVRMASFESAIGLIVHSNGMTSNILEQPPLQALLYNERTPCTV